MMNSYFLLRNYSIERMKSVDGKSSFAIEVFLFEGGLFLLQNKYKWHKKILILIK